MLPFSTSFVGADGTPLPVFNSLFYSALGGMILTGNAACGDDPGISMAPVSGAWLADQYAEGVVDRLGGVSYAGLCLRAGGAGSGIGYWWLSNVPGQTFFGYSTAGIDVVLATTADFAAGDLIRMEVSGSAFDLYVNGVLVNSYVDVTIPSGAAGASAFRGDYASGMRSLTVGNLHPLASGLMVPAFVGAL